MSARKSDVNDIIYELDNGDLEISSEDEANISLKSSKDVNLDVETLKETELVTNVSCSEKSIGDPIPSCAQNGGKISTVLALNSGDCIQEDVDKVGFENIVFNKSNTDCSNTTIFNEDIVIDSPTSNTYSDLGVVGCENKTPLITVRFKDTRLATNYKRKIKEFMLKLIKLHDKEHLVGSESETDLELDIWPEDLIEEIKEDTSTHDMFFVDTAPSIDEHSVEIPRYCQGSALLSNAIEEEINPPTVKQRIQCCFNCDGTHSLRDCKLPRNNAKIAEKRKMLMSGRIGRYHVEDEQKYGHMIPGRISGQLRHALGLKRHEIPFHVYRMRLLGYPPGWLEEARISHSGITMFDSSGNAILESDDEEGEFNQPGSKDLFDIKKIFDFPGFNVPASSRYKEEAHLFGLPPMSDEDSKVKMLQSLAPNAMMAYKRKKLTFFPSASNDSPLPAGQAEMDIDSDDEAVEFPSVPPLPDEAPPPPPPPPDSPPPLTPKSPLNPPLPPKSPPPLPKSLPPLPKSSPPLSKISDPLLKCSSPQTNSRSQPPRGKSQSPKKRKLRMPKSVSKENKHNLKDSSNSTDDIVSETVSISSDLILDDINDNISSERCSPSLDMLEEKKRLLLNELESDISLDISADLIVIDSVGMDDVKEINEIIMDDSTENNDNHVKMCEDKDENINHMSKDIEEMPVKLNIDLVENEIVSKRREDETKDSSDLIQEKKAVVQNADVKIENTNMDKETDGNSIKTPTSKTGQVKTTLYGTPILNASSPFDKLPSDDKFSKDICDVINFENLPNSTGKYKNISSLLKRVKNEVDRIQES